MIDLSTAVKPGRDLSGYKKQLGLSLTELLLTLTIGLGLLSSGLVIFKSSEQSAEARIAGQDILRFKQRIEDRFIYQSDHAGLSSMQDEMAPIEMTDPVNNQNRTTNGYVFISTEGNTPRIPSAPAEGYTIEIRVPAQICAQLASNIRQKFDVVYVTSPATSIIIKSPYSLPRIALNGAQVCSGTGQRSVFFYARR